MSVTFNHSILAANDRAESAEFLAWLLERPAPSSWGPFTSVELDGGVVIQFAEPPVEEIQSQHYAFLVDDATFDGVYERMSQRGLEHWADPARREPGRFNTNHGGRGVYVMDPAGHGFEVLTRPYGSDAP